MTTELLTETTITAYTIGIMTPIVIGLGAWMLTDYLKSYTDQQIREAKRELRSER